MADSPSVWMTELVEAVADCMESHSAAGPVGWRYHEEDDLVDLVIYATPVELLGWIGTVGIEVRRAQP